jgi:hypothetical protein
MQSSSASETQVLSELKPALYETEMATLGQGFKQSSEVLDEKV